MTKLKYAALGILSVVAFAAGAAQAQTTFGQWQAAPRAQVIAPEAQLESTPRYIVTAERLYANDETGRDWPGSDEVYMVFGNRALNKFGHSTIFGDFDTGETRNIPEGRWCLAPLFEPVHHRNGSLYGWQCETQGIGGPFNFDVQLYESDSAWTPSACLPDDLPSGVECQDDLIGGRTISYSSEELLAAMPNVGDHVSESVRLGGYTFTWRVQRIADAGTPPVIY
ncbi:hypothetical protein [Terricaulis silvestris]|uniref:Uncharacterized protein n=1 Tax=Terricaulis silvestris TaxID=2686094 RepID=A0A6I6MK99_9CAUL|nr:hypothetical protein [Terricaulis silvestris]QGZ93546.1 hypothetical protein DSM104635_00358 [Terricaulis silvestris]